MGVLVVSVSVRITKPPASPCPPTTPGDGIYQLSGFCAAVFCTKVNSRNGTQKSVHAPGHARMRRNLRNTSVHGHLVQSDLEIGLRYYCTAVFSLK